MRQMTIITRGWVRKFRWVGWGGGEIQEEGMVTIQRGAGKIHKNGVGKIQKEGAGARQQEGVG